MADLPSPAPDANEMTRLAGALADMRDALVDMSLLLKDYRFEMDEQQRAEVAAMLPDLLEKARRLPGH